VSVHTGAHTAHLWSSSGVLLAEAALSSETASGWQQATLSPPVAVTSNTTYVASYFSPVGNFALDQNFFAAAGVNNAPLHALQSGVDGPNGVFRYGPSGFPSSGGSNNYWVDVVFQTSIAPARLQTLRLADPSSSRRRSAARRSSMGVSA
jgi:hypothetical protein